VTNERISTTDQEGRSIDQLLTSAERELSAFVTAVHQLFGADQARHAADNWMEELAQAHWSSESTITDWRRVTIAAAARLARRDKRHLSGARGRVCSKNV
jgi:hypothetical protein